MRKSCKSAPSKAGTSSRATRRTAPGSTRSRSPAPVRRSDQPHPGCRQSLAGRGHRTASRRSTTASDREYWREWFPADFITESFPGQFRNWFYSLLVMSAALEDVTPYKTLSWASARCSTRTGEELHKSKGNSIPFDEAAAIVGADTMRWLFVSSIPEQNVRFPRIPTEDAAEAARKLGQPPRHAISGCRYGGRWTSSGTCTRSSSPTPISTPSIQ